MTRVKRTEQIWIKPNNKLSTLCHYAKNLFNEANYLIRLNLFDTGQWLRYGEYYHQVKRSSNYNHLPTQTAQQLLRQLDRNWKAFFEAMKEWKKHPEKFHGTPRPPKYKRKAGEHLLIFTNQQVSLKDQLLIFPKKVGLHVKTRLSDDTDLREVRIIPKETGYIVEVVFVKVLNQLVLDKRRVVGIDLGLVNLVTMINNIGLKPIIIKGGAVKSINQYYNKEQAKLSRIDDQQNNREKYGTKMLRLTNRRNRMIHDRFHKISRKIVNYCVENNIGTIVIGYNEGWKREIALRKNTNQNFVTIPFHKLLHKIKYKAEEIGLTILKVDESYTSKYSFLDNEPIKKLPFYQGKRINSSMYCASGGTIIHADVNGAYNILKKALPKAISANGIEAVGLQPTRWRLAAVTG